LVWSRSRAARFGDAAARYTLKRSASYATDDSWYIQETIDSKTIGHHLDKR